MRRHIRHMRNQLSTLCALALVLGIPQRASAQVETDGNLLRPLRSARRPLSGHPVGQGESAGDVVGEYLMLEAEHALAPSDRLTRA